MTYADRIFMFLMLNNNNNNNLGSRICSVSGSDGETLFLFQLISVMIQQYLA